jgi:hypothetical protein
MDFYLKKMQNVTPWQCAALGHVLASLFYLCVTEGVVWQRMEVSSNQHCLFLQLLMVVADMNSYS